MTAIDFHVHAFPDALADKAVSWIAGQAGVKPVLDGRISTLLRSMDEAKVEKSVILSIATRPSQFESILVWSRTIGSSRIVPLLSVHPEDPEAAGKVRRAAAEGFKGLKLHSYYQDCDLDDPKADSLYSAMEETGLFCVAHTGFDTAYPFVRRADPPRVVKVLRRFPRLKFVATHLGAWKDWDLVVRHLVGENLWVDTSFSLDFMSADLARQLIRSFPPERLLFGSDSPWGDQAKALAQLRGLGLEPALEEAILSGNARKLLE